ncbi:MAG: ImmA/IrrE family metallo-endopeptidase [Lachnospiraceae bacterium]|nr:ImmA/IrrE family metallo-endopeptidase [Lachnospiraceae bacterium]MCI1656016.1 ImmA/IrrE family metallo-endopeptidase [Lachnospiraceae bacterium]MCI2194498.1 ImmA/IrrE family metallo-endopeptidase [Lachnospiraceae bacterium]
MSEHYWKLTNEEYEFIKGEVIHIFVRYKVKCIPVSGFEIASKMGITLIPYSGLSKRKLEAVLRVSKDGFFLEIGGHEYICYNDIDRSYERQNWTILHEIGHIILDHAGHSDREEAEADFFAKYAIAPPVLIHKIKAGSAQDIYDAFDISMEAAEYAFDYYRKWRRWHLAAGKYTKYESALLNLYQENQQSNIA